jgi:hypothetical protein
MKIFLGWIIFNLFIYGSIYYLQSRGIIKFHDAPFVTIYTSRILD